MTTSDDDHSQVPPRRRPPTLVPRWLALVTLVVILAAGALSAWLVVNADFGSLGLPRADAAQIPGPSE